MSHVGEWTLEVAVAPLTHTRGTQSGAAHVSKNTHKLEMNMKTVLAALVVALGLMSAVLPAQAYPYDGYPQWARDAFTRANR